MIYLDYQASTPTDPAVIDTVTASMRTRFANPSAEQHQGGWDAAANLEAARVSVARHFCADHDEITFTSGATEADNIAIIGAARAAPTERRRILVSAIEHKAVLEAAAALSGEGFIVELIPVTAQGVVDVEAFSTMVGADVAVISVMAVNNEIGTIQPIQILAEIAAGHGSFFHTDATQAPAAIAIDLHDWGVDAASFSSHKIYGPKGVGALYVSAVAPWRPRPLMFGGGQEQGLRPGTVPLALCEGFAQAVALMVERHWSESSFVTLLRDRLASGLRARLPNLKVTACLSARHPGNLHVRFPDIDADDLLAHLQPAVAASTGSACTSGIIGVSHVLAAIGWTDAEAREAVRFSLGRFSTEAEVDEAIETISKAVVALERPK